MICCKCCFINLYFIVYVCDHFRSFDALNDSAILRSVHYLCNIPIAFPDHPFFCVHSLQNSLRETRRPQYMAIPFNLPSFDICMQVLVWANCMLDPVVYLPIYDLLCVRYAEEHSVASHLYCLHSALKIDGECPGFAFIQEDRYHQRTHKTDLWS